MSTITSVGNYARYLSNVRNMTSGQVSINELSNQMTTGKKSIDLQAYGPETQRLLALRTEQVKREAYINAIDNVEPRLQAADKVLTQLSSLVTDLTNTSNLPLGPGPAKVSTPVNADSSKMKVTVQAANSVFNQNATYTVTAVPSKNGAGGNGSFDITVNDGLGGRAVTTINLGAVPPKDGYNHTFKITGGPGDGAVLNLNFDTLTSTSSSSFTVEYPDLKNTKDRIDGTMREVANYLNERVGDRYLFSGARYNTQPVSDLTKTRQISVLTLDGAVGKPGDYYEVTLNGKTFTYTSTGTEAGLSAVAISLTNQINAAGLPVTAVTANGVITLSAQTVGKPFTVDGLCRNAVTQSNDFTTPTTGAFATIGANQYWQMSTTIRGPVNASGNPNIDIGDTYTVTVQVGNPNDPYNQHYKQYYDTLTTAQQALILPPDQLPLYQEYPVSLTVTQANIAPPLGTGSLSGITAVATQLATQINAMGLPVTATAGGTTGLLTLTSRTADTPATSAITTATITAGGVPSQIFSTKAEVLNGGLPNTMTIRTLPDETPEQINPIIAEPPDLPYYDTDYTQTLEKYTVPPVGNNGQWFYDTGYVPELPVPAAWAKSKIEADDNLRVTYGINSTDPTFQKLILGLRYARAAVENPGKYEENMNKAQDYLNSARDGMRQMQGKNSADLATLQQARDDHKDQKTSVVNRISTIEGVDPTEVAARLNAAMNTQQAAYTVAARTDKLSLLNYLA